MIDKVLKKFELYASHHCHFLDVSIKVSKVSKFGQSINKWTLSKFSALNLKSICILRVEPKRCTSIESCNTLHSIHSVMISLSRCTISKFIDCMVKNKSVKLNLSLRKTICTQFPLYTYYQQRKPFFLSLRVE